VPRYLSTLYHSQQLLLFSVFAFAVKFRLKREREREKPTLEVWSNGAEQSNQRSTGLTTRDCSTGKSRVQQEKAGHQDNNDQLVGVVREPTSSAWVSMGHRFDNNRCLAKLARSPRRRQQKVTRRAFVRWCAQVSWLSNNRTFRLTTEARTKMITRANTVIQ
jgi:hypothetical protein